MLHHNLAADADWAADQCLCSVGVLANAGREHIMWCLSFLLCSAPAEARPQGAIPEEESNTKWIQSRFAHCSDQITECQAARLTPWIIGTDLTNPGSHHSFDANSKRGHNKKPGCNLCAQDEFKRVKSLFDAIKKDSRDDIMLTDLQAGLGSEVRPPNRPCSVSQFRSLHISSTCICDPCMIPAAFRLPASYGFKSTRTATALSVGW